MKSTYIWVIGVWALFGCRVFASEIARTWTDVHGRLMTATMLEPGNESVKVQMPGGVVHDIPLERLIESDRLYVRQRMVDWVEAGKLTGVRIPPSQRTWPRSVGVSPTSVEVRFSEEKSDDNLFVYMSEDFEFTVDDKLASSVMTEVARVFEATRTLLLALPWGLRCEPTGGQERFQARLFETRGNYVRAGGPENSGGVYMRSSKVFMIPFSSLGLGKRSRTWYMDRNYSNSTLIHEVTHQLMDEILPVLPTWMIEGTAVYVENLPYRWGTFRAHEHEREMRAYIDRRKRAGRHIAIDSLEAFMNMDRATWHAQTSISSQRMSEMYIASYLLVYYFCHLDDDSHGSSFMRYMDAVHDDAERWNKLFADPKVVKFPDGSFRFPSGHFPEDLSRDTLPFKHLGLLLDGRSYADLADDILQAYRKFRIDVNIRP